MTGLKERERERDASRCRQSIAKESGPFVFTQIPEKEMKRKIWAESNVKAPVGHTIHKPEPVQMTTFRKKYRRAIRSNLSSTLQK